MKKVAAKVWATRPESTPLSSIQDLLNLAAIVEKETGLDADRSTVASVFHNRLKIGMRLQTDPTVIYGMGEAYQGRIRKADLLEDTPYNTYTRLGLPPTPIAAPSECPWGEKAFGGYLGHDRSTSVQSGIADAVFQITGKRYRDLPLRNHDLTWS